MTFSELSTKDTPSFVRKNDRYFQSDGGKEFYAYIYEADIGWSLQIGCGDGVSVEFSRLSSEECDEFLRKILKLCQLLDESKLEAGDWFGLADCDLKSGSGFDESAWIGWIHIVEGTFLLLQHSGFLPPFPDSEPVRELPRHPTRKADRYCYDR
jgi:hypothetical protein